MTQALLDAPSPRRADQRSPAGAVTVPMRTGSPSRSRAAVDVLAAAAGMGLATGLAESSYWLIQQHILRSLVWLHPGYWWMSPACQVALLVVPGGVLAAVAWRRPRWDVLPFAVTIFALLAWLNLLVLAPPIHFWAWILAACGLATATGRLFQKYRPHFLQICRWTTAPVLGLLVLAAVGQSLWHSRSEAAAVGALSEPPAGAPNVLVIVLDAVRADALELYGADHAVAPHLAALASQGVIFDQAWSTAPWTLPSHAGMFTGRLPGELSADWLAPLDDSAPTLAEVLAGRGWITGGFVGNTRYCSAETGLARGYVHYEDYSLTPANFVLSTALGRRLLLSPLPAEVGSVDSPGRKPAGEVTRGLLDWLPRRGSRPYFAFVNYYDAHDPYLAPPGFAQRPPTTRDQRLVMRHWWSLHKGGLSEDNLQWLRGCYEDCIRGLDAHVGRLLDELRRRGELDNTIIVVTSDHGEHFGDHGLFLHGNSLYEPLIHVPLVVVWPGKVPAGQRVPAPVSLRGLPNTILELTGAEPSFPGHSWTAHWTSDASSGRPVAPEVLVAEIATQAAHPPCHGHSPVAHGSMQCVRQGDLKYIRGGDGAEELYDLARDGLELNNLADDPAYRPALDDLRLLWEQTPGSRSSTPSR